MPHLTQIPSNKIEGKISNGKKIYDINMEMMSLEHEIEAKKAEVPQVVMGSGTISWVWVGYQKSRIFTRVFGFSTSRLHHY